MILIIDYHGSFISSLYETALKSSGTFKIIDAKDISLNKIKELKPTALILTSSPGLPSQAKLMKDIILHYGPEIPIFGLSSACLALAEAYGAKINPVEEIEYGKEVLVKHNEDPLFSQISNPFLAGNFYAFFISNHDLPKNLQTIAFSDQNIIMAIKHKTYPSYGVMFALETLLTPEGDKILENFIKQAKLFKMDNHD